MVNKMIEDLTVYASAKLISFEEFKERLFMFMNRFKDAMSTDANKINDLERALSFLNDDYKDLTLLHNGKFECNNSIFQMGQVFDELKDILTFQLEQKKIQLNIKFKDLKDHSEICSDKRRIMQVILNLLKNAIKFTEANGKIQITVRRIRGKGIKATRKNLLHPKLAELHGRQDMLEVSIRDNGAGVLENDLSRLF